MFPLSDSIPHRRFPFINLAIILFTVYVFYLQLTSGSFESFLMKYALIQSSIDFSDPFSLFPFVSAIFLHGGFLHILSNMWFLWVFGDNVEDRFGILYPLVYLVSGIVGNFLQFILMPDSSVPLIGASGAVAGVLGAYFVLFPHSEIRTLAFFGLPLIIKVGAPIMLGYWFFLQIISGATSLNMSEAGGVAFWAHVGGFVTGLVIAKLVGGAKRVVVERSLEGKVV